ncbi:hypothetical protein QAD02_011939, partial [Eretmocerus hayati]
MRLLVILVFWASCTEVLSQVPTTPAPRPSSSLNAGQVHDPTDDKTQEIYPCNVCGDCFDGERQLFAHLRDVHIRKTQYPCGFCSKTFSSSARLRTHMCIHTGIKPYHCQVCGKHFTCSSSLKVHMRTHIDERPYSCDQCSKSFKTKSNMEVHKLTHSAERHFHCGLCDLSFKTKVQLAKHVRIIHSRSKPYPCHLCDRDYQDMSSLQMHMGFHGTYKGFTCHNCHLQFSNKKDLQQHERSHSTSKLNHKPFACHRCEERYGTLQLLDRHIITHMRNDRVSSEMHVTPSEPSGELPKYTHSNYELGTPSARDYYEYAGMPSSSQDQRIPQTQELGWENVATTSSRHEFCSQCGTSEENNLWSCISDADPTIEEAGCILDETFGPSYVHGGLGNDVPSHMEQPSETTKSA